MQGSETSREKDAAGTRAEDLDTARLVTRFQAGDRKAFSAIYTRYFDRVYSYLRLVLNDEHEAEDLAQQAFTQALPALRGFQLRRQPFRAWLFTIVRHAALDYLRERGRLEVVEPSEVIRRRDEAAADEVGLGALDWITDPDLLMFVEKLPLPQRQVLVLRYMLDLSAAQIGKILGRHPDDVRALQYRAQLFLRERLISIGRGPKSASRARPAPATRAPDKANVLRARRWALYP